MYENGECYILILKMFVMALIMGNRAAIKSVNKLLFWQ